MKIHVLLQVFICCTVSSCAHRGSQDNGTHEIKVGGPCEGCEAVFETTVPFAQLNEADTLPDFSEPGPKIFLSGTVYRSDGKTPAPDVVLYVYHTDQTGRYRTAGQKGWGARNGSLRGWVKTNSQGQYRLYTLRPAPYPGRSEPAHIHIIIREPGMTPYYIDDFLFDDDPMLTTARRDRLGNRGGNGILHLQKQGELYTAVRNIYLGRGVPDYPANK
jgi:protocatechuate 3,4-dioxygenase, beta subunit